MPLPRSPDLPRSADAPLATTPDTDRAKDKRGARKASEAFDHDALIGYPGDGALYLLLGVLEVHEVSRQVLLVGTEVEVAVAAEVEEDGFLLAGLFSFEREIYRRPYRVRDLRRGDYPLRLREELPGLEGLVLGVGASLDQTLVHERRDYGRVAVVAEAPSVDARRHERVSQGVHLHERRRPSGVAEVVGVAPLRERGAGDRLDGEDTRILPTSQFPPEKGEGDPGEVGPAADAADDHVGVLAGQLHLL